MPRVYQRPASRRPAWRRARETLGSLRVRDELMERSRYRYLLAVVILGRVISAPAQSH